MAGMAIAVLPDGPKGRWERLASLLMVLALAAVVGLFAYSMLDAYVF
jgi:lysophospholipid acyltransferase (LPLAT)-like uncharacterized protein